VRYSFSSLIASRIEDFYSTKTLNVLSKLLLQESEIVPLLMQNILSLSDLRQVHGQMNLLGHFIDFFEAGSVRKQVSDKFLKLLAQLVYRVTVDQALIFFLVVQVV